MIGIADTDKPNACLDTFDDGGFQGASSDNLALACAAVDHGKRRHFVDHLDLGLCLDNAGLNAFQVLLEAENAVRANAHEVGSHQYFRSRIGVSVTESGIGKSPGGQCLQFSNGDMEHITVHQGLPRRQVSS